MSIEVENKSNPGEDADLEYLPIAAVAEVLYCPRNYYYRVVEGAEDENAHLLEGRFQEEHRNERRQVTRENSLQLRKIHVASEKLKVSGVIDVLEAKEDIYPVEYKKGKLKENLNDDVQVALQAMALEEELDREISRGSIYYGASHSRREVLLTSELRELVWQTVYRARSIAIGDGPPEPLADNRCVGCSLVERCLPQETRFLLQGGERPGRPVASLTIGSVLYVDEQGAYLRKQGERVLVSKDEQKIRDYPLCNIEQVILVGRVNVSTPLLKTFMDYGIGVTFLSMSGRYLGNVQPSINRNSVLRAAQAQTYCDSSRRQELARAMVSGKLSNMRTLLQRSNRQLNDAEVSAAVQQIGKLLPAVERSGNRDQLLGLEGVGSRYYFAVLGRLLKADVPYTFHQRNRRPPRDPVNALLSFGYSLLTKETIGAAQVAGLDPYLGFYHECRYGRPALALDLMEEFRAIIVDSVVLTLLNRGMIKSADFEYRVGGCYLNEAGRRQFYRAYEERRHQSIKHPVFGYQMPYYRIFELQARFLAKVIQGELPQYLAFRVR